MRHVINTASCSELPAPRPRAVAVLLSTALILDLLRCGTAVPVGSSTRCPVAKVHDQLLPHAFSSAFTTLPPSCSGRRGKVECLNCIFVTASSRDALRQAAQRAGPCPDAVPLVQASSATSFRNAAHQRVSIRRH
jgi:hypothetical protein